MTPVFSRMIVDAMIAHALADWPNECCGAFAVRNGRVCASFPAVNIAKEPRWRYQLGMDDLVRITTGITQDGMMLGGWYHSHPQSVPIPSITDISLAYYPEHLYVIVGLADDEPDVRAWRIVNADVTEVPLDFG